MSAALACLVSITPMRADAQAQASTASSVERAVAPLLDSAVAVGRRQDTLGFRRLVTPDFVFIHSTGSVDSAARFFAFLAQVQPDSMRTVSATAYREYGNTVVAISHQSTWVPRRGWATFRATDVVVRDSGANGQWRWAAHQSTALPSAPGFSLIVPDTLLEQYAGSYANTHGFIRSVRREGQRLLITAAAGAPIGYRAVTHAAFHAERGDAYVVFSRDSSGKVMYLEFLQPTVAERFERRTP